MLVDRSAWAADGGGVGQVGAGSGGSQGAVLNSWVSASSASSPCFAAVERYDQMTAKSASPCRVRQQPPALRCLTFTGRISLSAALLVGGTDRSWRNRRIMSRWL